jgi:hypothetical protein
VDVQSPEVELARPEQLEAAEDQQDAADERSPASPRPPPGRRHGRSRGVHLGPRIEFMPDVGAVGATCQKHPVDPSVSVSDIPVRVKTDACVDHEVCCRFVIVTESASWAKSPAAPFAAVFTVEASTPMRMFENEDSPRSSVMPICRIRRGCRGAAATRGDEHADLSERRVGDTDWQRSDSCAEAMFAIATLCWPPRCLRHAGVLREARALELGRADLELAAGDGERYGDGTLRHAGHEERGGERHRDGGEQDAA